MLSALLNTSQIVKICIGAAVAALILFMVIRTLLVKAKPIAVGEYTPRELDRDGIANRLVKAVQYPTVTMKDNNMDGSIFLEYQKFLESAYPLTLGSPKTQKTLINKYAVIYVYPGTDPSLRPVAVLAHQDVVPAPEEGWEVPPFSGEIKDDYIYGRGSQDMKSQAIAGLDGLEALLKEGREPKRSIYFCYGHDEELRGYEGTEMITKYLEEKGVRFEYVIDEGGTILDGKLLGIDNKIALIGTCEKGYADYRLEVVKNGGHSSAPTRRTAVGMLAEAIADVELSPRRAYWNKPAKEMFKALAPHMKFPLKLALVNRDILSPLLKWALCLISPFTNGLLRTTLAPTQCAGAFTPNTLPPKATANINCRLNIGDTTEKTRAYIQKIVGKKVKVFVEEGSIDPSPVSVIDSYGYKMLEKTISEVYGGYVVAPFPFIAATDAKYYYKLSDSVYRFTPFEKTPDDAARIHAINERQDIEGLVKGVQFFLRLYENTCF